MSMSTGARTFRDQAEQITRLEGALAQAEGAGEMFKREAETLRAEITRLTTVGEGTTGQHRGW